MTVLDRIKLDEPDTKSRYTEMLKEWLKLIHPMPSWEGLMEALKQPLVNCSDLALRIAEKHLSGTLGTKSLSCSPVDNFFTAVEDSIISVTSHLPSLPPSLPLSLLSFPLSPLATAKICSPTNSPQGSNEVVGEMG